MAREELQEPTTFRTGKPCPRAEVKCCPSEVFGVVVLPAELRAQRERHRSPLVWRVAADFLAGRRHPLELVQHLA